ncbi:MAG: caspase family protein, partial [Rubrivivax sp.]|nr:caspase family protein [Rubrivivax sp.]
PAAAAPISVTVVRPKTVALAKAPPIPSARAVRAAALPQIQRKIAVLIGLDNYVDDRIPLLENAGRDVEAMARVLETQLGYQTVVVRDASREAIIGVLNRLALTARPNDSVVVYYAGHGTVVEETGLGYWIPASADADRPESWISNNDIGKLVGSIRASQVVLISDSCFSGSLVSDRRVRAFGGADDPGALLQRRAAVVMSSGGNEPVADGSRNGHSPFAASLMQSLSQLDNWRPGNTVFEQIRQDVTRRLPQTPHYGAARQGRHAEGADYVFEQRQLEQVPR